MSAGVPALVPSTGCAKPCLCTQVLEERWQPGLEGPQPQPSGEVLLNGSVGQDPFEKAYLLLLGQLNAVSEELARTREELRRSKAPVEPEERKPLDFLKRKVSPCPTAVSGARSRSRLAGLASPHSLLPAEHS